MITTYTAAPGIDVLTSSFPIPGFGLVPINAFVLHGPEPVLVDTGGGTGARRNHPGAALFRQRPDRLGPGEHGACASHGLPRRVDPSTRAGSLSTSRGIETDGNRTQR